MTVLRIPRCSGCSRPLLDADPALGQAQVGPCCAALPEPWERSRETGLYAVLPGDELETEPESYPQCTHCGSTCFVLRFTRTYEVTLRSLDPDAGDRDAYFESGTNEDESEEADENGHRLECRDCGRNPGVGWAWT